MGGSVKTLGRSPYRGDMRGGIGRGQVARMAIVGVAAVLLSVAACAAPEIGPSLPTFPTPEAVAGPAPEPGDNGFLPDDCTGLLAVGDLGALLGLPLDSVALRTTIGVPAPSVGRIERVACQYSGAAGSPAKGRPLLGMNAAAYVDAAAAAQQWRTNADAESGDRRELPIGAASAVLIERRGEAVLTVVYGSGTLTIVLPDGPRPGDRSRADVAVDLALRVLPALAAMAPAQIQAPTQAPPPTPTPVVAEPARAAAS